jgi:hypothetical protein
MRMASMAQQVAVLPEAAQWLEYEVTAGGQDSSGDEQQSAGPPLRPKQQPYADQEQLKQGQQGWQRQRVYVPSGREGWRWAFHSCAGFSCDMDWADKENT